MVKKRFSILVGGGLGAIAFVIGGVAVHDNGTKTVVRDNGTKILNLDASWGESYQSIAELKTHTDVAVAGHFTKAFGQTTDVNGIPYTDFAFTVDSVLYDPKGKTPSFGNVLRVHQTGGVVDNVTQQISDDPLFSVNEQAVLFLREYQPGFFYVVGGPTGRFEVSNSGDLSSISGEGAKVSGSLASFVVLVKNS